MLTSRCIDQVWWVKKTWLEKRATELSSQSSQLSRLSLKCCAICVISLCSRGSSIDERLDELRARAPLLPCQRDRIDAATAVTQRGCLDETGSGELLFLKQALSLVLMSPAWHPRYTQPHHGLKMLLGNHLSKGLALVQQ
ncbi:hypothetical protein WJX77_012599 [Trebouxia sp. C0004]